jgi:hypothetical protein
MDVEDKSSYLTGLQPSQFRGHSRTSSVVSSRSVSRATSSVPSRSHQRSVSVASARRPSGKVTESNFSPVAAEFLNLVRSTARELIVLDDAFPSVKQDAVKKALAQTAQENIKNESYQLEYEAMLLHSSYMSDVVEYVSLLNCSALKLNTV